MRLVLFEPDIPQNAGSMLRLAACLDVPVDVVEPCGFVWSDRYLRRAGMDYIGAAAVSRHTDWVSWQRQAYGRIVLLTTAGETAHVDLRFREDDNLVVGRESAGVPPTVRAAAHARIRIPMSAGTRSLNVATAAAIVLGEALRQIDGYPGRKR